MTRLRMEKLELTYEAMFSRFASGVLDAPGALCDGLLIGLEPLGVTIEDLAFDKGDPAERGISCEVDQRNVRLTVKADRLELSFADLTPVELQAHAEVVEAAWKAVGLGQPGSVRRQALLFEMDSEILDGGYQPLLDRRAAPPSALPKGTESAVVYYLPAEPPCGYGESNLVLNRSALVSGGLSVSAMIVFEGDTVKPGAVLASAWSRLVELLGHLEIECAA